MELHIPPVFSAVVTAMLGISVKGQTGSASRRTGSLASVGAVTELSKGR